MTAVQECASSLEWQDVRIRSASDPKKHYSVSIPPWGGTEDVTCDCPGYTYRGTCRHLAAALAKICNWSSAGAGPPQTEEQRLEQVCPRCGRETVLVEET